MKIEYKILWLDDKIQDFIDDELVEEIEKHLLDSGFRPDIITTSNVDDFDSKLDGDYDLILTDYHLGKVNGDVVVEKIRDKSILTEILFYSAKADLKDTNKISRISFLQTDSMLGNHNELVTDEIRKLIDLTIKKFQHIVAMRGMIMHETSSLDEKMMSILRDYLKNKNNKDTVEIMAKEVIQQLKIQFSSKLSSIEKCLKNNNLTKISKDSFVFSSAYKVKTMSCILNNIHQNDFSSAYNEDIVKTRNNFAHATLERDQTTGREYFKKGDITFDESLCKKIRKDIVLHDDNLTELMKKIQED